MLLTGQSHGVHFRRRTGLQPLEPAAVVHVPDGRVATEIAIGAGARVFQ